VWPGPAVVFEDRFFSFLQEQDFNGSMVAFLAVNMYLPFLFTWVCSLDEFTIYSTNLPR